MKQEQPVSEQEKLARPSPPVAALVEEVAVRFPCFGGGRGSEFNPIAQALKDQPPCFAAGVDVAEVVQFLLARVCWEAAPLAVAPRPKACEGCGVLLGDRAQAYITRDDVWLCRRCYEAVPTAP